MLRKLGIVWLLLFTCWVAFDVTQGLNAIGEWPLGGPDTFAVDWRTVFSYAVLVASVPTLMLAALWHALTGTTGCRSVSASVARTRNARDVAGRRP